MHVSPLLQQFCLLVHSSPDLPTVSPLPLPNTVCISGKAGDEKLFVAEVGGERLQFSRSLVCLCSWSGVWAALRRGVRRGALLRDIARRRQRARALARSAAAAEHRAHEDGGKSPMADEVMLGTDVAASPAPGGCSSGCLDPVAGIHHKTCPNMGKVCVVDPKSAFGALKPGSIVSPSPPSARHLRPTRGVPPFPPRLAYGRTPVWGSPRAV